MSKANVANITVSENPRVNRIYFIEDFLRYYSEHRTRVHHYYDKRSGVYDIIGRWFNEKDHGQIIQETLTKLRFSHFEPFLPEQVTALGQNFLIQMAMWYDIDKHWENETISHDGLYRLAWILLDYCYIKDINSDPLASEQVTDGFYRIVEILVELVGVKEVEFFNTTVANKSTIMHL